MASSRPSKLEVDLSATAGAKRTLGPGLVLRFVCYWMPVWIPLALLAQVALRGLKPALVERERLLREESVVTDRHDEAQERLSTMRSEVNAWSDPIYRERLRRVRSKDTR